MRHRNKRRRLRGFIAKITFIVFVLAGLWGAGFFFFLEQIPQDPALPAETDKADAIVVLTGGGGRLEKGLQLLGTGAAAMLFISGVDPGVDKSALLGDRQLDRATLDCCVILGHAADDTSGNAEETARWMASQGFSSLYIVTANYHMPRSLVEFRAALPAADLRPHVVHPQNVHLDDWWRWPGTIRLLAGEYTKYVATRARTFVASQV